MIPDDAVEAAARAMSGAPDKWERLPEKFRSDYRESVRYILEAAAPTMLAHARDNGRNAGQIDPCGMFPIANPYLPVWM